MRLFVALQPSGEFREALVHLQRYLRSAGVAGLWLDADNLHLTLAFIGEWPEPARVVECLPEIRRPFSLTLDHPGFFPEASVLWAGVRRSEALEHLAESVRRNMDMADIPFDHKRFKAHITLARKPIIPAAVRLSDIRVPQAKMIVREVCLYSSVHGPKGMEYTPIAGSCRHSMKNR